MLVVHPSVPAHTLAELIAYAKANPGKMNFASGGHGSSPHLAAELLKARAGIDIAHVSYRGTGPALQDLVGGHVQMMFSSVSPVIGHLQNGSLRALARLDARAHGAAAGRSDHRRAWLSRLRGDRVARPGRPRRDAEGRDRHAVYRGMMASLNDPDTRQALTNVGIDVVASTPEELAAYIQSEIPKWSEIIKASGTKLD